MGILAFTGRPFPIITGRKNKENRQTVAADIFLPLFAAGHNGQLSCLKYGPEPLANKS